MRITDNFSTEGLVIEEIYDIKFIWRGYRQYRVLLDSLPFELSMQFAVFSETLV